MSDKISVHLFKEVFMRLRPCHNETIASLIHLVGSCGGKYGFVSSHAANTFALATFAGLFLKKHYPTLLKWGLIWSAVVSYSRIYLGVHYPGDILAGALLGVLVALFLFLVVKILNKKIKLSINI